MRSFSVQQSKQHIQDTEPIGKFTLGSGPSPALVDAMDDKKRQLSDMSVYKYYFRTLGKKISLLFVVFAATHGFLFTFPSKLGLWSLTV